MLDGVVVDWQAPRDKLLVIWTLEGCRVLRSLDSCACREVQSGCENGLSQAILCA